MNLLEPYSTAQQSVMLKHVRRSIQYFLQNHIKPSLERKKLESYLLQPAATFVTLKINGQLRGCIGQLVARRALIEDLTDNAIAAATKDPRFEALTLEELDRVKIEISILTEPTALVVNSEAELLEKLQPGVDGLILIYQQHQATFLPSVWHQLPSSVQFVEQLKIKAGLSADFWSSELELKTFQTISFSET